MRGGQLGLRFASHESDIGEAGIASSLGSGVDVGCRV